MSRRRRILKHAPGRAELRGRVALFSPTFLSDDPTLAAVARFAGRRAVRWTCALALLGVAVGTVAHSATHGTDFRLNVWYPGQALFHGRDPYDIASFERYYGVHVREMFSDGWFPLYGPVHLWLAAFFALFPASLASAFWFALNLAGLAVIAAVVTKALDRRLGGPAIVAVTALLVLSRPGRANLEIGQAAVFYTLVTYVAWSQVRRRPWLAAFALAFALGKPPFGLPLLALLLVRRMWTVLGRGVAVFVVASAPLVAWLSVNAGSPASLWHAVIQNLSYTDKNPLDATGSSGRIDALSLIARYVHGSFGGAAEVGAFVVVVGIAALVVTRASAPGGWSLAPAVLMLLGLATVLSVAHQYYDLLVLAWPLAAALHDPASRLVDRLGDRPAHRAPTGAPSIELGWRAVVLAVSALPALAVTVLPGNETVKILGLGSGTAIVSTVTTVALLLAMGGAVVSLADRPPSATDSSRAAAEDHLAA